MLSPLLPIRVRPCTPADHAAVLSLAPRLATGIAPWRQQDAFVAAARRWIDASVQGASPDHAAFVAEDATHRCVGFASIAREAHFTGEVQAYLGELVVAADVEGQGIGQALLAAAETWAREQGYRVIALDTGVANDRARAFYAQQGYAEESIKLAKLLA